MILKWFWREWKTPSLIIVWLAMSLSVAAILSLGNLGDRLEQRLNSYSKEFLAGDIVLRSTRPADATWLSDARASNLKVSEQLSFQTMAFAAENSSPSDTEISTPLLVSVKATDDLYPLYGELRTAPAAQKIQPGGVIVAKDALVRLGIKVGDFIDIGDASFKILAEIVNEPDAGFSGIQTSPKVLMHLSDIDKTGAVQLGSRLTYRYMFAGDNDAITRYQTELEPKLTTGFRFVGGSDASGLNRTVDRAKQFLILCSILTILLSACAVAVAMTHYTRTRYKVIAVLKTLGATHAILRRWIIGQWIVLLLVSILTGGLLGILTEHALILALGNVLPPDLPKPTFKPWIWASASVLSMALLVGLRPYIQLLVTPPIRVLRQVALTSHWPLKIYMPVMSVIVLSLLLFLVGLNKIVWSVLFGILLLGVLLGVVGWLLLGLLKKIKTNNLAFRLAINRLLHQPIITISQLSAFSISFMLLSLLIALQGDLISRWQAQLPKETPSYILMNINEAQKQKIDVFFENQSIEASTDYFTIVLARITKLNGIDAKEAVGEDAAGAESLNREINLTQLNELPSSNLILEGTWPPKKGETSVEQSVANQLGIQLGDEITFDSGGRTFSAKVTSIRQVNWESMQLNFYFIFPIGDLDNYTKMWITPLVLEATNSIKLSTESAKHNEGNQMQRVRMMADFSHQFPTISVLDVTALLKQAEQIIAQVSGALQFMAGLVILCGILLMFAQVQVSMRQRHIELVVYKTLGANANTLNKTIWIEFLILGAVSGFVAILGAEVALWSLQKFVFEFPWEPNYKLWLMTPIASSSLLILCGFILSRKLLNRRSNLRAISAI